MRVMLDALRKCDPRVQWRNPVLMLVEACALLATVYALWESVTGTTPTSGGAALPGSFHWAAAIWMWLTLYTANVAEALAEGHGRAQTAGLRASQASTTAHRVRRYDRLSDAAAQHCEVETVSSAQLRPGDVVLCREGDTVPADGVVIWGIASVDESAVTGESAPVIRESGGDRSAVTGGTRVLSDRVVCRVTVPMGDTRVDQMIALAEGARRQKSPNELALTALLASFSISFVLVALTLNAVASPVAAPVSLPILAALVASLIPSEIAALLSVTGIAGMYRLLRSNVLVSSAKALETAGDITAVLLDKTGTITRGNRRATQFIPVGDTTRHELVRAAVLASIDDPTPEGRSTLDLARETQLAPEDVEPGIGRTVPFSAQTRLSGVDLPDGTMVRKGAESAVLAWLKHTGHQQRRGVVEQLREHTTAIARTGGTPLVVAVKPAGELGKVLGVIQLKDVVKSGVAARVEQLRALGVRTVMVTGDNPLTAAAIAAEAGVDDHLGDATPEAKLELIKAEQAAGHFVAMSGDGTNDAPALAQADVGVAMNSATAAAREAANIVALDDDPTKLVDIIEIGRRSLATRGALTTFNIANDLVRYFALFPALFVGTFPALDALNVLRLSSPASAVLSTLIFSVVVIIVLIPLAMFGVPYRTADLGKALNRNLLFYGVGGLVFPAVCIKVIDLVVSLFPGY